MTEILTQEQKLKLLKNHPDKFWRGLSVLPEKYFMNNRDLTEIDIQKPVKIIGNQAFYSCQNLQSVSFPNSLESIKEYAFTYCVNLENVDIPDSVMEIESCAFSHCDNLKRVKLSNNITKINSSTFQDCHHLEDVIFPKNLTDICGASFLFCKNLKRAELPNTVKLIDKHAFAFCHNLKYISFPADAKVSTGAFLGTQFKFAYQDVSDPENIRWCLCNELPKSHLNIVNFMDLRPCYKAFYNFNIDPIEFINYSYCEEMYDASIKLSEMGIKLPYNIVRELVVYDDFDEFLQNNHFIFFNKELKDLLKNDLPKWSEEKQEEFYKFIIALGCFSNKKMIDNNGKESNTYLYQKASSLVSIMYKSKIFDSSSNILYLTGNCNLDTTPSQNFVKFLMTKNDKNEYENLKLLLELNKKFPNIFSRLIPEFNKVMQHRISTNAKGKPVKLSWEKTIKSYLTKTTYSNVKPKDKELAEEFISKGIPEKNFKEASKILQKARRKHLNPHILKTPLSELDKINAEIEKSKNLTTKASKILEFSYAKNFKYEMLDKYDPKNFVLGAYCTCCSTINSYCYGKELSEDASKDKNVQNLVVKDVMGNIIAKATLYINRRKRYIVFNDFEINKKYREKELVEAGILMSGVYADDQDESEKSQAFSRKQIFNALMRGIDDFKNQYDKENPKKKIKKIHVGIGYNKLINLCDQFCWTDNCLKVPKKLRFCDAENAQYILYDEYDNRIQSIYYKVVDNAYKINYDIIQQNSI